MFRLTRSYPPWVVTLWFIAAAWVASPASAITATFLGSSGDWSDPSNWSTDPVFPNNTTTTGFDVVVRHPATPMLDKAVTVDSLVLERTLFLSKDLRILGALVGRGALTGTAGRNSVVDVAGPVVIDSNRTYTHVDLRLRGSTTWERSLVTLNEGAQWIVEAGATLTADVSKGSVALDQGDGTGWMRNDGMIRISQSRLDEGVGIFRGAVHNRGLMEVGRRPDIRLEEFLNEGTFTSQGSVTLGRNDLVDRGFFEQTSSGVFKARDVLIRGPAEVSGHFETGRTSIRHETRFEGTQDFGHLTVGSGIHGGLPEITLAGDATSGSASIDFARLIVEGVLTLDDELSADIGTVHLAGGTIVGGSLATNEANELYSSRVKGTGQIVGDTLLFGDSPPVLGPRTISLETSMVSPGDGGSSALGGIGSLDFDGHLGFDENSVLLIELRKRENDRASAETAELAGPLWVSFLDLDPTKLKDGATFTVFEVDDTMTGEFAGAPSGTRIDTIDGLASFVVNYGAGSPFDPRAVVLSDFQAPVPEPSILGLWSAVGIWCGARRHARRGAGPAARA